MKEFQKLNEQEMKQLIGVYSSKDCLKDIGKGNRYRNSSWCSWWWISCRIRCYPRGICWSTFWSNWWFCCMYWWTIRELGGTINEKELLNQEEMLKVIGGKINWGSVGGSCVGGAIIGGALGGLGGAGGGCLTGAIGSIWDQW